MSQPVLAAIDLIGDDTAPAALGLTPAPLTSTWLLPASTYPVDPHVDGEMPDVARVSREDAEASVRRIGALVEQAAAASVHVATAAASSAGFPASALHRLAERENAGMLVIVVARSSPSHDTERRTPDDQAVTS